MLGLGGCATEAALPSATTVRIWQSPELRFHRDEDVIGQAAKQNADRRVGDILVSAILPIATAILGTVTPRLWDEFGAWIAVPWIFLIVFWIASWFRSSSSAQTFLSLLMKVDQLQEELDRKDQYITDIEEAVAKRENNNLASFVLRIMSAEYVRGGIPDIESLEEMLGELMTPLYLDGGDIFGFGGSELWSFSAYFYSERQDRLLPVWREKSRNHPSSGLGRTWGRGQGHVGKAFVDRRSIVTRDASDPEVAKLSIAPEDLRRTSDDIVYRSFAAIPIHLPSLERPFGVLVATSNKVGRFDEDAAEFLQHYAETIAVIALLTDIEIDCLLKPDKNILGQQEGDGNDG